MLGQQKNSIDCAKGLIITLMKDRGIMTIGSSAGREEWIYQAGKFYSINENRGIGFDRLKRRIMHLGDFSLYVFKDKIKLKVTPEKIVVFD